MSHKHTDGTKLGSSFNAVGVSTIVDQDYPNDWEMEDTASSSVRVVGEVVAETDVSSLGLSPQVTLTAGGRLASWFRHQKQMAYHLF